MSEEITARLAYRTYMYELLRIVFGATPDAQIVESICADATFDALGYYASIAEDEKEANAYRELTQAVENLKGQDFVASASALKSEYTHLFLVPGERYVHPWESPYIGKEVMMFQESTLDVRRRYSAFGFEAVGYKHFPEDHIAMMLHFLGAVSAETLRRYNAQEAEEVDKSLCAQGSFIKEHLTTWRPKFIAEVVAKDSNGFYRTAAGALDAFIENEAAYLAPYAALER